MKSLAMLVLGTALAFGAQAQEAPQNTCEEPVMPQPQASDVVVKYFNKHLATYQKCIDKFVADSRDYSKAEKDPVKSKAAWDAAEDAQKKYNDIIMELRRREAAAAGGEEDGK